MYLSGILFISDEEAYDSESYHSLKAEVLTEGEAYSALMGSSKGTASYLAWCRIIHQVFSIVQEYSCYCGTWWISSRISRSPKTI
jgi:hypothetical protein